MTPADTIQRADQRERKPPRAKDFKYRSIRRGSKVEWIKGDWFCVRCGKQDVWQLSTDGDDYYVGYSATCHSCEMEMQCLGKVGEPIG